MAALKSRLYEMEMRKRTEGIQEAHDSKGEAGWGNQIRSYVLHPYQMVKDLRTNVETSEQPRRIKRRSGCVYGSDIGIGVWQVNHVQRRKPSRVPMVPIDFQAACLYSEPFGDIDFDHFIETITAIVAEDGLDVGITHRSDNAALFLKVGTCCIKIELMRTPCALDGFKHALSSQYLNLQSFDFASMVRDNQQYILLSVVSGDALFDGEHLAMIADAGIDMNLGENETQQQMELRLKILHMATLYICTYAKPDVIHWTQSEQMYTGDTYSDICGRRVAVITFACTLG